MNVMDTRDNRDRKVEDTSFYEEQSMSCEAEFKPLDTHKMFDLKNMSFLLPRLATQSHTALHHTLEKQFVLTKGICFLG